MIVVLTEKAEADLEMIGDYIAKDNALIPLKHVIRRPLHIVGKIAPVHKIVDNMRINIAGYTESV